MNNHMALKRLGKIIHLQIQRDPLKRGTAPNRVYTTGPLLSIESIRLGQTGIIGLTADGGEIIDVHNSQHPRTRNRGNENGLSVNFTGHYQRIRQKFGEHLHDGCAGENILVENAERITLETPTRLAIENSATGDLIYLDNTIVAPPCVEFSTFVWRGELPTEEVKPTLQFLDNGMRGYYATLGEHPYNPTIHVGDTIYLIEV